MCLQLIKVGDMLIEGQTNALTLYLDIFTLFGIDLLNPATINGDTSVCNCNT
jgi:hypothetical protein